MRGSYSTGRLVSRRRALVTVACAAALLAQTTAAGTQRLSAETSSVPPALAARVHAFFTAWQGRNLTAMYEFYCAPYRTATPRADYLKLLRLLRFPIVEFRIMDAAISGDTAKVRAHLTNETMPMQTGLVETDTTQVWLQDAEGSWCKESEPALMPFPGIASNRAMALDGDRRPWLWSTAPAR